MKTFPGFFSALAIVQMIALAALPVPLDAGEVLDFTFDRKGKRFSFYSEVLINAPAADVFEVLTDYNAFYRISNVMVDSGYREPTDDGTPIV